MPDNFCSPTIELMGDGFWHRSPSVRTALPLSVRNSYPITAGQRWCSDSGQRQVLIVRCYALSDPVPDVSIS